MKFNFESDLEHQKNAIDSVVNIFEKLETKDSPFSILRRTSQSSLMANYGFSNQITTNNWKKDICEVNIHKIQEENRLKKSNVCEKNPTFDVEMETGTGKTYVYLRTILELSNKYRFKKFIIVVPSIAIKEGVKKTLEITKDHFNFLYSGLTYSWKEYDSKSLEIVRNFAQNDDVEIIIMNIHQMNKKDGNVFYKERDDLMGHKAIDLIKQTNPIVIIDEPQSTSSGEKSLEAIKELNPLFTLRYSATFKPRKNENLVYKLDPADAYNKKLVKQIAVYSKETENENNSNKLIELIDLDNKKETAKIKIRQLSSKKEIKWVTRIVKINVDLYHLSNQIEQYKGLSIEEFNFKENEIILTNGINIKKLEHSEEIDKKTKRLQIKETIIQHLEKQREIKNKGIKVLSLFFIDKVDKYRIYTENNKEELGEYAKFFEDEFYGVLSKHKEYWDLFNIKTKDQIKGLAKEVHDGYFSIDKKKKIKDTKGESNDDASTYQKIMKDKEKLLSFSEKLCFIFSHSALKEGWDNPNVFQICTLKEYSHSEIRKRQEIGRGLRLCVDQNGRRVYDENINKLSVITTESYGDFVAKLQNEFKEDGVLFGVVDNQLFFEKSNEQINKEQSKKLYEAFKRNGYIDKNDKWEKQLDINDVMEKLSSFEQDIFENPTNDTRELIKEIIIKSYSHKIKIKNGNKLIKNKVNREVINSKEFTDLWKSINQKTVYNIKFDTDLYIKNTQEEIKEELLKIKNNKTRIKTKKVDIELDKMSGVQVANVVTDKIENLDLESEEEIWIPDIISDIETATRITRRTIVNILRDEVIINSLKNYHENIKNIIISSMNKNKIDMMVDGIEYKKVEDYYLQEKLEEIEDKEFNEDENVLKIEKEIKKYPYEYVVLDSKVEKEFAVNSKNSNMVTKFIKLPSWFKIQTPLGTYNPDWAIYKKDSIPFVVETKGSSDKQSLREKESKKITCGEKHFKSIGKNVKFILGSSFDEIINKFYSGSEDE